MKGKLTWIAALALALGLIASGCGGDDGNDDTSEATTGTTESSSLSKAEFVEQANEICKQGNAELNKAANEIQGTNTGAELNDFINQTLIPNVQGQIDDIRALGLPDDEIAGTLDQAEQVLDDLDAEALEGADPFAEVNKELNAYGLAECADG